MRLRNIAKVINHCVFHPRDSYQAVAGLTSLQASGRAPRNPRERYWSLLDRAELTDAKRVAAGEADRFAASFPAVAADGARTGDPGNPLWDYAERKEAGPGIIKWSHYFEIYQRHFAKFVGRPVHVVEVGIYSGGSLPMWRHYFGDRCRITGIDIEPACRAYENDHTKVLIGDQGDRAFWREFRKTSPPVDILIDDGGHTPEQQRVTLEEMLPHLSPGGVFLCEDIHGRDNAFAAYAHTLAAHLHHPHMSQVHAQGNDVVAPSVPFQQAIHSAHIYPFAVVFERATRPFDGFRSYARGNQWQPFLGDRS